MATALESDPDGGAGAFANARAYAAWVAAVVYETEVGEYVMMLVVGCAFAAVLVKGIVWGRHRQLGGGEVVRDHVLVQLLGSGGFGEVHRARHMWSGGAVALKIPYEGTRVAHELRMLRRLNPPPEYPNRGFPRALWVERGVIAMELLGPSLANIKKAIPEGKYSLKTAILIADQLIDRLEFLHTRKSLVHRDIKPENLLLGLGDQRNIVHLCDFGLTTAMYDARTRSFKPFREGCSVYGTPYFTSLNADRGVEQSMRDDIESMAYVLVYLLKGTLPWIGLRTTGPTRQWHERLVAMKRGTPVDELCAGLPSEFAKMFTLARGLRYTEYPPYDFLRGMLRRRYAKAGYAADDVYDWTVHGADWRCWAEGGSPLGRPDEELEGSPGGGTMGAPTMIIRPCGAVDADDDHDAAGAGDDKAGNTDAKGDADDPSI